jgi:hypothetical protein
LRDLIIVASLEQHGARPVQRIPPSEAAQLEIAELNKILSSTVFSNSRRAVDFLRFVVERTLAGEARYIKEYRIGLEVFGRNGSYDPKLDPVVRIEAGRLRSKLAEYYRNEGQNDPIQIELPKGTYVPVFQRRESSVSYRSLKRVCIGSSGIFSWLAILAVIVISVGLFFHYRERSHEKQQQYGIVLADFVNDSSDAVSDRTLKQALSIQLEQTSFLSIVDEGKVNQTLALMEHPPAAPVNTEEAKEVCVRTGSRAVITGSISRMNAVYVVGLQAIGCGTGETLVREQVEISKKEDILRGLRKASASLRGKLVLVQPEMEKRRSPLV